MTPSLNGCGKDVFIERAEKLDINGIKAMSMSDEEYRGYCKGREVGRCQAIADCIKIVDKRQFWSAKVLIQKMQELAK